MKHLKIYNIQLRKIVGGFMVDYKKIDEDFQIAKYGLPRRGNHEEMWNSIKNNTELLKWAIQVTKDKFGERDIVNGLAICDSMLVDYESVDMDIYQELINTIYSNKQVARIVLDGPSNGGYSFLLMSLWNRSLVLTPEQRAFALDEAMNKIGTKRYYEEREKRSLQLDEAGITDETVTVIDIDGCKNPIGLKTYHEYFDYTFNMLSDTQAHGMGVFDIRYAILTNPNWSIEEKNQLLYEFYPDDEVYDEVLEEWEWGIINEPVNFKDEMVSQLDKSELYEYSYEDLLKFYDGNKDVTEEIYTEIQFCRMMHMLRPQTWELEFSAKEKVLIPNEA